MNKINIYATCIRNEGKKKAGKCKVGRSEDKGNEHKIYIYKKERNTQHKKEQKD